MKKKIEEERSRAALKRKQLSVKNGKWGARESLTFNTKKKPRGACRLRAANSLNHLLIGNICRASNNHYLPPTDTSASLAKNS
jgi:hypothetical protein